jgi:hypothetical protein
VVKLVYCICRKPELSREQFVRYWAEVHGMAELWFDDIAAVLEARRSPEWAASTADEVNFADPARSAYFVSEERQIL